MSSLGDRALDRMAEKTARRLNQAVESEERPLPETGIYQGFNTSMPYGRQHMVSYNGGVIYGQMIVPTAVSKGKEVAVYLGKQNLFDTL
jgi:hypothetical protein